MDELKAVGAEKEEDALLESETLEWGALRLVRHLLLNRQSPKHWKG